MINQLPSFPFQFSVTHQIILYVFHKEATALNFYSPLFKVSVLVHFNNEPSILREKWTSLILSVFRGIFWYFFSLSITQSCLTLCNPTDCSPPGSSVQGQTPGKNTRVGCCALLQGVFPTHGLNPGLPHRRRILYCLHHQGMLVDENWPF